MSEMVTLQKITMVIPNGMSVYAPTRLPNGVRKMPVSDFVAHLADHPHKMLVSFDADGKSNPVELTAYATIGNYWIVVQEGL